jgi:hypothetical protein
MVFPENQMQAGGTNEALAQHFRAFGFCVELATPGETNPGRAILPPQVRVASQRV